MLEELYCGHNKITKIPSQLKELRVLHCDHNLIKEIPLMPSLHDLRCQQKHKIKIFDRYVLNPRKPGNEKVCE